LIKTYFAEKEKIDPKNIIVVSIMPCTAKKYEVKREELKINGLYPVDFVLTTRELARLFKEKKINLKNIKPEKLDNPLGLASGAGVIYGASGGVMESALRTAIVDIFGKKSCKIEFKEARGMRGVKRGEVNIDDKKIRLAVVNGLLNAKKILEELKENPSLYHYIEIMACPGGCIGGGGQPLPTSPEIRKKRAEGLYKVDNEAKLRMAHENPIVKEIYQGYLNKEERVHHICHTKFSRKKREN
jgi:NADH-quinone oxidoreductase subunit G/NADP-reducing hydrogenase subunit HndD